MKASRTDGQGYSTKVTAGVCGGYGCRVLRNDKVIAERWASSKRDIAPTLREMLRMVDKCCNPSEMASASRIRNFCREKSEE
jgi:hypothetical protein